MIQHTIPVRLVPLALSLWWTTGFPTGRRGQRQRC